MKGLLIMLFNFLINLLSILSDPLAFYNFTYSIWVVIFLCFIARYVVWKSLTTLNFEKSTKMLNVWVFAVIRYFQTVTMSHTPLHFPDFVFVLCVMVTTVLGSSNFIVCPGSDNVALALIWCPFSLQTLSVIPIFSDLCACSAHVRPFVIGTRYSVHFGVFVQDMLFWWSNDVIFCCVFNLVLKLYFQVW